MSSDSISHLDIVSNYKHHKDNPQYNICVSNSTTMAKGEESSDYNNIVELCISESAESKIYTTSEERGCDGRRGVSNGDEEPNLYEIEW